jgi:hypothetical protein
MHTQKNRIQSNEKSTAHVLPKVLTLALKMSTAKYALRKAFEMMKNRLRGKKLMMLLYELMEISLKILK